MIKRSERNSFCLYICREHIDCTFQIFIGKRQDDGMFLVKRVVAEHSGDLRQPRAADGRRHKKRRASRLKDMIVNKVRNTKKETPVPADVIKTEARHSGVIVSYINTWRALCVQSKNFELIVPYLEQVEKAIPRFCNWMRT
jgi:hypothetical protein